MPNKERRYAQDTEVPTYKSQEELKGLLRKAGAGQVLMFDDLESKRILCGFTLGGRQFRIKASTERPNRRCAHEQLEREAWRAMVLIVKAKLEVVAMGNSTIEEEFMANLMLPSGETLAEHALPLVAQAYSDGQMPRLLPGSA